MKFALSATIKDQPGVLSKISNVIAKRGGNISFTQQFLTDSPEGYGKIYFEIRGIEEIDSIIKELKKKEYVKKASKTSSFSKVFGKRVIIIGGGAQVSEVAKGAISEADRHNIRGEKISVDTIPLVGEETLSEAIKTVEKLHRAKVLVLAGALFGGEIREAIKELGEDLKVISLRNVGSAKDASDLVVSDPTLAGVLAVMTVSERGEFELDRVSEPEI
ncbi:hypothetical protein C9439_08160 [archaeon SCG-AAA382B04]|nr:hypothetical protein C9439_08160 [archaeon SCG-AAA382B04]